VSISHRGSDATHAAPYVSNSSSGSDAAHMCQIIRRGAARHIQLHMCHFLSGRHDAAGIAPYVSIYSGE